MYTYLRAAQGKGIRRQGIGSFVEKYSYVSTLCPVVVCPYSCTPEVHCLDHAEGGKLMTVGEDMNLVSWTLPSLQVDNYIMGHNEEIVHVQLIPHASEKEAAI